MAAPLVASHDGENHKIHEKWTSEGDHPMDSVRATSNDVETTNGLTTRPDDSPHSHPADRPEAPASPATFSQSGSKPENSHRGEKQIKVLVLVFDSAVAPISSMLFLARHLSVCHFATCWHGVPSYCSGRCIWTFRARPLVIIGGRWFNLTAASGRLFC